MAQKKIVVGYKSTPRTDIDSGVVINRIVPIYDVVEVPDEDVTEKRLGDVLEEKVPSEVWKEAAE